MEIMISTRGSKGYGDVDGTILWPRTDNQHLRAQNTHISAH